jgi:CubicO group peptidase (beta-lactamase class C family)
LRASSRYFVRTICIWTALILTLLLLAACGDSPDETAAIDYSPMPGEGWEVASPGDQTLDPELVGALYREATEQDTLYSLLVVKDGVLIAEGYFNGGSAEQKTLIQSASKSYISALVGIAIEQGCLSGVEQKMIDFFPEIAGRISDPRKRGITIRQMLQMRAGYPDEETDSAFLDALYWGVYPPLIEDFPLVSEPGTAFNYSNVTYSLLAILLERACGPDLKAFAQAHLFEPTGTEVGDWLQDREGNYIGSGGIHVTPRDAAVFGQLYLDRGVYDGEQVVPAEWVGQSLRSYSERARSYGRSLTFRDLGYGYGWWTARAGEHNVVFGWGHGGQLIVLLDELDIVIVTTADPFFGQHDGDSWKHEKAILNMVGDFIESLPAGR